MTVRACDSETIDTFFSIGGGNSFREGVERLFINEASSPSWCFILTEGDACIGRVGYMEISMGELRMFGLRLPLTNMEAGSALLKQSLETMRETGALQVTYQLYDNEFPPGVEKLLEQAGMKFFQKKVSYVRNASPCNYNVNRLVFVPVSETGYDLCITMIRDVTRDTLDKADAVSVSEHGEEEAARRYGELLSAIDNAYEHWYLAYRGSKTVGLVIPQVLEPGAGAINYIGVVPSHRGRGYVQDLLVHGIDVLSSRGCAQITADIDIENRPMEKALIRNGFESVRSMILYKINWQIA